MKLYTFALIWFLILLACNSQDKKADSKKINSNSIELGAAIYKDFCINCHMANGEGIPKTFPPLANSDYLKTKRTASIKAIKYGQKGKITVNGVTYNSAMAPLGLNDDEIANVMNYITNSWGNKNKLLITREEVSKLQP